MLRFTLLICPIRTIFSHSHTQWPLPHQRMFIWLCMRFDAHPIYWDRKRWRILAFKLKKTSSQRASFQFYSTDRPTRFLLLDFRTHWDAMHHSPLSIRFARARTISLSFSRFRTHLIWIVYFAKSKLYCFRQLFIWSCADEMQFSIENQWQYNIHTDTHGESACQILNMLRVKIHENIIRNGNISKGIFFDIDQFRW